MNIHTDPKTFWDEVNKVRGTNKKHQAVNDHSDNICAESLNSFYASISHDHFYKAPNVKETCQDNPKHSFNILPYTVFKYLDSLKSTSCGLDMLPSWFLKLSAPFISEPLAYLFSSCISLGFVPEQWKTSLIVPIPKVPRPTELSHYRPISLTPILSRTLERLMIRQELYPFIDGSPIKEFLQTQFAFKPTGSTTAALIHLMHIISNNLVNNPFVHVFALDFTKAFDTLSHYSLTTKLSELGLPDEPYNWLCNYLADRSHVTKFDNKLSSIARINASVVQGSAIGPMCFILNMTGLKLRNSQNFLSKYADDCYLIVPSSAAFTISEELENIHTWASSCNLKLNKSKTKEIIICNRNFNKANLPPPTMDIERVDSLCVLGVTFNNNLSFELHIDSLLSKGHQRLYALKTLKNCGLSPKTLSNVTRSILFSLLTYASPAWWGFTNASDCQRLDSLISKAKKWGLFTDTLPSFESLCAKNDDSLFKAVLQNKSHALHFLLPPEKKIPYSLRKTKSHNLSLPPNSTSTLSKNFVNRMLYRDIY